MDPISSFNPNTSIVNTLTTNAVTPTYGLLSAELSLSIPGIFNNSSTYVGISARGQLLSAAVQFQNTLRLSIVPDTAGDLESLLSNARTLVDSFNTLQQRAAAVNDLHELPASGISTSASLTQPLDTRVQATYTNGDSTLTRLSQLGITFQPPRFPGAAASLSLDEAALQTAFASDPTGAASLLSTASGALSDEAGRFISRSGSQYASLDALMQASSDYSLLFNTPQRQTFNDLFSLLSTQPQSGNTNWGRVYSAMNEYNLVSHLFG